VISSQPRRIWIFAVALLALFGCGKKDAGTSTTTTTNNNENSKVRVVTTLFPLSDWAREVGGERVNVVTLLPAGSSPHTFEPTNSAMQQVARARLFIKVGLQMDDWARRLASAGSREMEILSAGDQLAYDGLLPQVDQVLTATEELGHQEAAEAGPADHTHGGINPHFWLDPVLARETVQHIRDALSKLDPEGSATYAQRTTAYLARLDQLNQEIAAQLQPCAARGFVSFHHAYPYFAHRYGLHVVAVIEEYPGKTPSDRYVKNVANRLRQLGIKTVFTEPQLSPQVARIIAEEVGARVDLLDPYGSENTTDRSTYENLIRYNTAKLKQALCGAE